MKTLFSTILLTLTFTIAFSQKVSFDDDGILIDKVKKFDFKRMKKGGLTGLTTATLSDLTGMKLLIIEDTSIYLNKLPYELEEREAFETHALIAPQLNKTILVQPIFGGNIRKDIMRKLDSIGFFKTNILNESIFNDLAKAYGSESKSAELLTLDTCNVVRFSNFELSEKTNGKIKPRKPGKTYFFVDYYSDGKSKIADINLEKSGSHSQTYNVKSSDGSRNIATIYIFPGDKKANILTKIDNKRKWFSIKPVDSFDREAPIKELHNEIVTYLVHYGYL